MWVFPVGMQGRRYATLNVLNLLIYEYRYGLKISYGWII